MTFTVELVTLLTPDISNFMFV